MIVVQIKNVLAKKAADALEAKYGKRNAIFIPGVLEKEKETVRLKYGCDNVFQNEEIKNKSKRTMLSRYGVEHNMQLQYFRSKAAKTCIERYGVDNYSKTKKFRDSIRGENSPRWISEKTPEQRDRYCIEYREWRDAVFEKYNYTCQKCGKRHTFLNAHHIRNWKDCIELRYSLDNGVCLCRECHYRFHSLYGKKNNNIEQINEFINDDKKIC